MFHQSLNPLKLT
ncbi:hypothetical protein MTR67_030558 [Solanum verrucosum]|uniref:Uncharacterized protein n=1 Tax=Solanum verrucosum TaxID=315347 RepID=A0AAF0RAP1_SOLVR|nr:hypothetical protein MTR67_030558 [Solanum verrucosum]